MKLVGMKRTSLHIRMKYENFPKPLKLPPLWSVEEVEKAIEEDDN
jgi:predicted DNA-binding transcriptional regulator AlpA